MQHIFTRTVNCTFSQNVGVTVTSSSKTVMPMNLVTLGLVRFGWVSFG